MKGIILYLILGLTVAACDSDDKKTTAEEVCTKYAQVCGATGSELTAWVDECVNEYRATPEEEECFLNSTATSCDEIENECSENGIF